MYKWIKKFNLKLISVNVINHNTKWKKIFRCLKYDLFIILNIHREKKLSYDYIRTPGSGSTRINEQYVFFCNLRIIDNCIK